MMGLKGLRVTTNNHEKKQVKDMEEILCYLVASQKNSRGDNLHLYS